MFVFYGRKDRKKHLHCARSHKDVLVFNRRGGVSPPANIRFLMIKREAKRLPYGHTDKFRQRYCFLCRFVLEWDYIVGRGRICLQMGSRRNECLESKKAAGVTPRPTKGYGLCPMPALQATL